MSKKNHLVIVSQESFENKLLSKILQSYQLTFYDDIHKAKEGILKHPPHLVIIDSCFEASAFDLCRDIVANQITSTIPVIFMFNSMESENISKMFHFGGSDYINKPFNQYEIVSRIHIHINYARQQKELEFLAHYDPMTQTYNRRTFFKKAEQALKYSVTNKVPLQLIIFHLSTLYEINDGYGHFTGDKVLQEFSQILKDIVGAKGIIGRLNGDNFTVLLSNQPANTIEAFAFSIEERTQMISLDHTQPVKIEHAIAKLVHANESIDDLFLEASRQLEKCKVARTIRNY